MACPEERRVGPRRASRGVSFSSLWHRLACRRQASARAPPVSYGVRRLDAALPFVGAGSLLLSLRVPHPERFL